MLLFQPSRARYTTLNFLVNAALLKVANPPLQYLQRPIHTDTLQQAAASAQAMDDNSSSAPPPPPAQHSYPMSTPAPSRPEHTSGIYDTSFPIEVRKYLRTYGLIPPVVESQQTQAERCLRLLNSKPTPIEKYQYLSHLRASNVHLFFRLLAENVKEITPLIYTPTVGEACIRWSELYTQADGMYLSASDRGNVRQILDNWPHHVEITVVTDGSRILGLGDLGINGMGIPVGKLQLYTACAGIRPDATLPLTLDFGTTNKKFLADPLYMGSKAGRISAQEEHEFMDELMAALTDKWPGYAPPLQYHFPANVRPLY